MTKIQSKLVFVLSVLISSLLSCQLARSECTVQVPFDSSFIGRNFSRYRSGRRFPITVRVEIKEDKLVYYPSYYVRTPYSTPSGICAFAYEVAYSPSSDGVSVTQFPSVEFTGPNYIPCIKEREEKKIVAVPSNKDLFRNYTKSVLAGLRYIRNEKAPQKTPDESNRNVDVLSTYIRTVLYQNRICLD